jgi:hypothetical protein
VSGRRFCPKIPEVSVVFPSTPWILCGLQALSFSRLLSGERVLGADEAEESREALSGGVAPILRATKAARLAFREMYALFVAAYREAAEKLRKGDRTACFPIGSFPPALPFVGG